MFQVQYVDLKNIIRMCKNFKNNIDEKRLSKKRHLLQKCSRCRLITKLKCDSFSAISKESDS